MNPWKNADPEHAWAVRPVHSPEDGGWYAELWPLRGREVLGDNEIATDVFDTKEAAIDWGRQCVRERVREAQKED